MLMQCISLLLGTLKGEAISDQHVTLGLWLLVRYFLRGQVISWDIAPGTAHHSSQGKLSELAPSARNSLSPKLLICQLPDVSHDRRSGGFDLYYLCTYHTRTYVLLRINTTYLTLTFTISIVHTYVHFHHFADTTLFHMCSKSLKSQ